MLFLDQEAFEFMELYAKCDFTVIFSVVKRL